MLPLFAFSQSKQSDEYYNKGVELYNAWKFEEAIQFFLKCDSVDFANGYLRQDIYYKLSLCYYKLQKLHNSQDCIEKQIELMKKIHNTYSESYADVLDVYAAILLEQKQIEQSIDVAKQALDIYLNQLGEYSYKYASTLGDIGECYFTIAEYSKCIELLEKNLEIDKKILKKDKNSTEIEMNYIAHKMLLSTAKRFAKSAWMDNVNHNIQNPFTKQILYLFSESTQKQREHYYEEWTRAFSDTPLSCAYNVPSPSNIIKAYDSQLFAKNILLNVQIEIKKVIDDSNNIQIKEQYNTITKILLMLDSLESINANSVQIDSLYIKLEKLEKELVISCKKISDYTNSLSFSWEDVQDKLEENDIAIEFAKLDNLDSTYRYIALFVKKGMSHPTLLNLFSEIDLEIDRNNLYSTSYAYNIIWKPLERYLKGIKNVYFSPCGKFHTIAIEYLPDENGEIFAKKFNAYRLSSTRELAFEKEINPNKKASVYGGILYDFSEGDWQDLKNYKDEIEQEFRDIPDLSGSFRAGVTFLQGAKVESETITDILRNGNYQVSDWAESYATEESFKKLSGSGIKMLHIATHGFYEPESKQNSFTDFLSGSKNNKEDLSLSRSGLLLAGAASAIDPEKRKQIPEGVDDGILTAKEISRLDFKGLDLVVLSACQTGLGEVTSEGVFGLQRGFKKAGARTIVMSLWKVDDNATKDLMTEFYKNLVQCKSKHEAFVLAQDFVRQKYQDPQKWAAFIMVDGL